MRSFFFIVMCVCAVACGSSKPTAARVEFDPEMAESCVPEWQEPPAAVCVKNDDGTWTTPEGTPVSGALKQAISLYDHGVYDAVVQVLDPVIHSDRESPCGLQAARWYRGRASYMAGRYKEAYFDLATVVRDGPNNPYYVHMDEWFDKLDPHLPRGVIATCRGVYGSPTDETAAPE